MAIATSAFIDRRLESPFKRNLGMLIPAIAQYNKEEPVRPVYGLALKISLEKKSELEANVVLTY